MKQPYLSLTIHQALINVTASRFLQEPVESARVSFLPQNWQVELIVKGRKIRARGRLKASPDHVISFRVDEVKAAGFPIPVKAALSVASIYFDRLEIPYVSRLEYHGGTLRAYYSLPPDLPLDIQITRIEPGAGTLDIELAG